MSTAISHSRVESYLSCRRKDWYGYQFPTDEGTGIRKVQHSDSLGLGTALHRIAAAFYQSIMNGHEKAVALSTAISEYETIIGEGWEEAGGRKATLDEVCRRFFDNEVISEEYEILAVEEEFNLETDEGEFPFVVDLIVRHKETGLVYVVDHKTAFYLYDQEKTGLMPQIPKYIGALRALGYNITAGFYQIVRTQALKGETMNKAQLVEHLESQLKLDDEGNYSHHGVSKPLSKYTVAVLDEIAADHGITTEGPVDPKKVYQWIPLEPSLNRVMETMREQFEVAVELRERDEWDPTEQDTRAWRVSNQTVCKSCQFALICTEELRGGNVGLVLQAEYEPKPKRPGIEVSEEIDAEEEG
jgi:hypothetical protein